MGFAQFCKGFAHQGHGFFVRYGHIYKVALSCWIAVLVVFIGCSSEPYDTALLRAQALVRDGKCQQALKVYEKTLPRIPASNKQELAAAEVGYGDCLVATGKVREAFVSYQNAWQADEQNLDAHQRLAQLLAGEKPELAAEHARFVLKQQPDNAIALAVLGEVEEQAGNAEAARPMLERALAGFGAQEAQKPMVAVTLAQVYVQENRVDDARRILTETAQQSQDAKSAAIAWLALGRLEEQEGNKPGADAAYRAGVRADDAPLTNYRLAQFLERSARISEAEEVLKHLDAMRPSEPSVLAEARLNAGRNEDAAAVMRVTSARAAAMAVEGDTMNSAGGTPLDPAESLNRYRQLLDGTSVAVLEAELALKKGDLANAETSAKLALQRSPDSPAAHYVRGLVFAQQDRIAEAKEQWNSALESDADYVPAEIALARQNLREGDLSTAEKHISSVVRDEPGNLEALCIFARVLLRQGKIPAAMSIAQRGQAVNPHAAEPLIVMGEVLLSAKKYGSAFLEFERALLLEPDSPGALDGVLEVYRHGKINHAVLAKMERVASAPPASPSLLEISGRLYAARKMYADAERALLKSLKADPKRDTAAVVLAQVKFERGQRDPESFLPVLTANGTAGPLKMLHTLQGMSAEKRGDKSGAVRSYESAVRAGEASGLAANNLAWEYAQQGIKLDEALRLASSAVDKNPKNPAALDTLGFVQLKLRNYTEAVTSFSRAVELMSGEEWRAERPEVYKHLAEALDGAGMTEQAARARAGKSLASNR